MLGALLVTLWAAAPAAAQDYESLNRTDQLARLDPGSRSAIESILDSARASGLPTEPLLSKTLEGISKRADNRRIVSKVREVYVALREARLALGANASKDELSAAAGALQAGVPATMLARFRSAHAKSVTVPLVVLADLITRGVPRDTASNTIMQLWQGGAADGDFLGLWRGVERDIVSGAPPAMALMQRAREYPLRAPPAGRAPGNPPQPETTSP
ncbi:MAG: hypothetical protein JWO05_2712 [Gemmatimonadetes bacterium]|nr:hypothetical protein [Gemmatimonadota bacterium]